MFDADLTDVMICDMSLILQIAIQSFVVEN